MNYLLLLLATAWLWLGGVDVAHADPFSAIAAISGFIAKIGVIGKLILTLAVQLGVSMLQKKLAKKKEKPTGVDLSVKMGDDVPMGFVVGKYATAGRRKYIGTWGQEGKTPNAYVTDVIELSNLPSYAGPYGITSLWIGDTEAAVLWDQPHPDGRGYPVAQYRTADGTDYLWVRYLDGSQTVADAFLRDKFGSHPERPWLSSMIGLGCQAIIITCRYHEELFSGGLPQVLVEPHPLPFYDLRKDSTNGGFGSHRWDNPATWEPTVNPMVIAYNVKRGIYYDGTWLYGGQNLAAFRLPASGWIAATNECDAAVEASGGLTEPAYRCGYEIFVDREPLAVLEELAEAASARLSEAGGVFKPLVGAPGAAVYSFSDDDVIITEGQSFEPFPALDETYNAIEATYPEPREKWAAKDAPARYDADLEAEDGNRRLPAAVSFDAVPFAEQVQRLMLSMLKDYRRFRVHQFYLPPDAYALEPNDVVSWTSERNGYQDKKFLVVSVSGNRLFNRLVTLKEIDPSDYDWGRDLALPVVTGWIGRITAPVQPMTGWAVSPATINDANGTPRRPAIQISCAADQDDVVRVHVRVRLKATGAIVFDSDSTPYAAPYSWLLSGNWLLPATEYEAQGRYIPYSSRPTEWSDWLSVTTPDTRLSYAELEAEIVALLAELQAWITDDLPGQVDANAQGLLAETQERVAAIQAQADAIAAETQERVDGAIEAADRYRAILADLQAISTYVADVNLSGFERVEDLRTTLTVRINDAVATLDTRITLAVNETQALALRATTLEAQTAAASARMTEIEQASVDRDTALSIQLVGLQAGTANQFDPDKIWRFDGGSEGWSGVPAASVDASFLRPGNGSNPYVVSPIGLAVAATANPQVRLRVKKTGSPTWIGYCWWRTPADGGWTTAQRVQVSAPVWEPSGAGYVTFDMPWTGTVDQIRMDMSSAQSATDAISIDWVAIGAPAPGATRADLITEQQARASGDAALASSITAMQALLEDAEGDIEALASGVSAMETSVTNLGDAVQAQAQRVDEVETELQDKASNVALAILQAEVAEIGGGGVVSQGQAVTALRNELLNLAAAVADNGIAAMLARDNVRSALTSASQSLSTRIDTTGNSLTLLAEAVTAVQVSLGTKASASALDALTTRMTVAEDTITSSSAAITSLQSAVASKADGSALSSLQTTVSQQGNTITTQGNAITSLQNSVAGKADGSALASLQNTVTQQGDTLTSQGSAITSLQNTVASKASTTALNALSSRVDDHDGQITAQANALTTITANVGSVSAEARWRMSAEAGAGGRVIIGAQARLSTAAGWKSAGWWIDVPTGGGAATFLIDAERFALAQNNVVPFVVEGGVAYLANVNIGRAVVGDLVVERSNIREGAISHVDYSNLGDAIVGTDWTPITGLTAYHGAYAQAVLVFSSFNITADGEASVVVGLWDSANNAYTAQMPITFRNGMSFSHEINFTSHPWRTETQFRFDVKLIAGTNVIAHNRMIRALSLHR